MLTRMAIPFDGVTEAENEYTRGIEYEYEYEYEYEHEHEHEHEHDEEPGQCDADDGLDRPVLRLLKF